MVKANAVYDWVTRWSFKCLVCEGTEFDVVAEPPEEQGKYMLPYSITIVAHLVCHRCGYVHLVSAAALERS